MVQLTLTCNVCEQEHQVEVEHWEPGQSISFKCPDVDRRYRLSGFFVDGRRGLLGVKEFADEEMSRLRDELGGRDFDAKLERWKSIDYPPIGLIDEYPQKIAEIIKDRKSTRLNSSH